MSSKFPIGVATRYKTPPPAAADFSSSLNQVSPTPSLARAQSPNSSHGILVDSRPSRRLPGAAVRVQMPEMQSQDGKDRTRQRPASQEVPALRRQSRITHLRAGDPI